MNKNWEKQLMNHVLNEKYLGEMDDDAKKMQKEDKKAFLSAVANFHEIGEMVYSNAKLKEVSETLSNIVQQAEALTLQESEHWFDNVTVSRHMKQMNEAYKVFEKTANEMSSLQQRLESAYDDMGTVLNRYYSVNGALSETEVNEDQYTAGVADKGQAFHDHMTSEKSKRLD
jgi:DNA-binding transcriptional regulator GbsR (MarR family)